MAINQNTLTNEWVQQGTKPNCGSCCVGSIMNYARVIRNDHTIAVMDENAFVGLTLGDIHGLGSVSSRLHQWITTTYPAQFTVAQVKVDTKKAHWGGLLNLATGGDSHRPLVDATDPTYFAGHNHRFLLREFSAWVVLGHFII